jgi:hypothetical protein
MKENKKYLFIKTINNHHRRIFFFRFFFSTLAFSSSFIVRYSRDTAAAAIAVALAAVFYDFYLIIYCSGCLVVYICGTKSGLCDL